MANAYVSSDFDDKYFSILKDFYKSYDVTTKPCADNFEICDDLFEKDPYMCHEYTSDSDDVDIDVAEEKRIQTFLKNGCRCEFGSSKTQCSDFISVKVIEDLRPAMQEALHEEKDMAILSYFVQTRLPLYVMSDDEKVKRQHCSFNLFGQRVCRKSFLFAYDIGIEKFYFLMRQYDINGAVPRIHGNKKRLPQNAFSIDVHINVRSFIENYAEENAVLLPGRIPGCKDTDICLLQSAESKHDIWVHYDLSCKKANLTSVSYPVFCKLWKVMTPWIIVSKTDDRFVLEMLIE